MIVDLIIRKHLNRKFALSILILATMYSATEYRMLYSTFIEKIFISHRTAFHYWSDSINVAASLRTALNIMLHSHYHAGSLETHIILLAAIMAWGIIIVRRRQYITGTFLFVSFVILFICLIAGFTDTIYALLAGKIPMLKSFYIARFYFLLPTAWMILFAMSLKQLSEINVLKGFVIFALMYQLLCIGYSDNEYKNNVKLLLGKTINEPTYSQFMSESLFAEVGSFINKPKSDYRVVCIGFHPSIAQFNGFYTLDSYQVIYDLDYKIRFRHIIDRELHKNEKLMEYFDGWGSRCYIFANELGQKYLYGKESRTSINNLELNTYYLKAMGASYIFSSVKINNCTDNHLALEAKFTDKDAWWDIYLYRIL
jgi:hypothetical protein